MGDHQPRLPRGRPLARRLRSRRAPARPRARDRMTDRAALYRVEVRRRRGDPLPLGDLDGAGTSLVEVLAGLLDGFAETGPDGAHVARVVTVTSTNEEVFAVVQHGRRGVAADI